jgi:hypothetical protein
LRIDTVNAVVYVEDTGDPSKFATDPNVVSVMPVKSFTRGAALADIQAVNGQRVMGLHTRAVIANIALRTAPTPGQAIADTVRNAATEISFEIMKSDGTPIGTIMGSGFAGGAPPPGAPLDLTGNNYVITGGTGAFLGARGKWARPTIRPVSLYNAGRQSPRIPRTGGAMEAEHNAG